MGGLVARERQLRFRFDGRELTGLAGDTLASALLANGIKLVGRSFKYHRPRGILSAGSEEPNALVELRAGARREPNTRATVTELFDGLDASSQNRWPSLNFDLLSATAPLSPLLRAGFYYKTFMWPAKFWEAVYEPMIRRAAGLGKVSGLPDPDHYERAYAYCDVLVVGGGPAGISAALAAGRAGARVILCDEDFRLGGRLLSEKREIDGKPAQDWLNSAEAELESLSEVRVMRRTTVFGQYDHGTFGAVECVSDHLPEPIAHQPRQRVWRIVAQRAILAAGAIERPMLFSGNDLPGVMLAGAARSYVNRFAVSPGQRAVIVTSSDDGWRSVADFVSAGIHVEAIVDTRESKSGVGQVSDGVRVIQGASIVAAKGSKSVSAIDVLDQSGRKVRLSCDLLAMSNGWDPTLHLSSHLSDRPVWDEERSIFLPSSDSKMLSAAGAANGRFLLEEALREGARQGAMAAEACGFRAPAVEEHKADPESAKTSPVWQVPKDPTKCFVDYQNDVTASDIVLAHQEGFKAVEHLKRYTTLGMATDQGKTGNVAALAIMGQLRSLTVPQVGTTVFRPPYTPVAIGALAGHYRDKSFRPTRYPPGHKWAGEQGAVFVEAGPWMRAHYFPRSRMEGITQSATREALNVRERVGVANSSPLGQIDIQGADASEFLDRLYCNDLTEVGIGRVCIGVLIREDGFVLDEGPIARLGTAHYIVGTTTANAARVMQHLEFYHQAVWPWLDVQITSVAEQWARFVVAGPRAREVMLSVVDSGQAGSVQRLQHHAICELSVGGGISARLSRHSFSGELSFELSVPASVGETAIRKIMNAGERFGIAPYGTEAVDLMRIEKGYITANEMTGQTTASDLGLEELIANNKDYVGRLMSQRHALRDPTRQRLVGLKALNTADRLNAGAHLVKSGNAAIAKNDEGYVTSAGFSPTLGHWIGLGLLRGGPSRLGEHVRAFDFVRNHEVELEVCSPVFIDPKGEKLGR
ncbi:sarcosine oxidase subunit alpha family protein [Bradyrhizobium sp. CCGUVB23]|nr:sarcosine oxidase subunit alpha family protein [Bradyrhizobium sp. CCGUVB23]MCP3463536.1 sarcosine oxidase subunit alpha family protein [Bradyrhizobium sp. CCGUVB23]